MKTIIVTGVSQGLGLEIAKLLLEKGNKVFGLSRTKNENIFEIEKKYKSHFVHIGIDLLKFDDIKKIFKTELNYSIKIDALVNNAATAYDELITNADIKKIEEQFSLNVFAPILFSKYVLRNMLLHKTKGSLIHISSISAHTGYKGLSMYAASKGAIEAFSKNLAREWGEYGIRSNCIVAGFMETQMSNKLSADQKDRIYKRTSLKIPVSMKSVSETISFLISDASESITGQNIFIDSGTI